MTRSSVRMRVGLAAALVLAIPAWPHGRPGQTASASTSLRYRVLVAEDSRADTPDALAPIFEALAHLDTSLAQAAVRALGRLERPDFVPQLRRALHDSHAPIRAEAANALGQVAAGRVDEVASALRERLTVERDAIVLGPIYETLGRLPYATADGRRAAEPVLADALAARAAPVLARLGAARAFDHLIRGARKSGFVASEATLAILRRQVVASNRPGGSEDEARVRRVALSALNSASAIDDTHARAMYDADPQVRRLAVAGVGTPAGVAGRPTIVAKALDDRDPTVRLEALRVHARSMSATDCAAEIAAVADPNPHVSMLAIDSLATACPADPRGSRTLEAIAFLAAPAPARATAQAPARTTAAASASERATDSARTPAAASASERATDSARTPAPAQARTPALRDADSGWLRTSHAIVALARRNPAASDWPAILSRMSQHPRWVVRTYAVRAAAFVTAPPIDALTALAGDANPNVREAAIGVLARLRGRLADAVAIKALETTDAQVIIAACQALRGTSERVAAAAALVRALAAITATHQDTSRDARVAILERLREVAQPAGAAGLTPYLADFDPRVAALAAEVLSALTGQTYQAVTTKASPIALPSAGTLQSLPPVMRVTMANGRAFEIQFYLEETPVTVWRIVRLAQAGYYNGLTFHRIVPNFVVQGGSPGAHEVVGDGPFMRDETGMRSNNRGTIGISTRGRDTGDAQMYINTIDNPRLDHEYFVFGDVVRGMDVVDVLVEGDVIAHVEFLSRPSDPAKRSSFTSAR